MLSAYVFHRGGSSPYYFAPGSDNTDAGLTHSSAPHGKNKRSMSWPCLNPPEVELETCVSYLQVEHKLKPPTKQWADF